MPRDNFEVTHEVRCDLATMGAQLRAARERRGLTVVGVAEALNTSAGRVRRAEAGNPTVAMGIYAMLLDHYGLRRDLGALAWPVTDPIAMVRKKVESRRSRS